MKLRVDWERDEIVRFTDEPWLGSPEPGVERKLLERDGAEVARATSIVRYAPGSAFAAHEHARGEELLVLEGTFQDENGDYPAGSYVRNPAGSRHRPFSRAGCVVFVKLRQFEDGDALRVALPPPLAAVEGLRRIPLHRFDTTEVALVQTTAPASWTIEASAPGIELLVLDGDLDLDGQRLSRWDWARTSARRLAVRTHGAGSVWVKMGHARLGRRDMSSSREGSSTR